MVRGQESGHVLITALLVFTLLSMALALAASSVLFRNKEARREVSQIRLTALTDSCLAATLAELDQTRSFRGFRAQQTIDGGSFTSSVTTLPAARVRVECSAQLGVRERRIGAEVLFVGERPRVVAWGRVAGPSEPTEP